MLTRLCLNSIDDKPLDPKEDDKPVQALDDQDIQILKTYVSGKDYLAPSLSQFDCRSLPASVSWSDRYLIIPVASLARWERDYLDSEAGR